jgi:hypothetical protein
MVELGRIDIAMEVSMIFLTWSALARDAYSNYVIYLPFSVGRPNSELVFDPSESYIDMADFGHEDWEGTEFSEDLTPDRRITTSFSRIKRNGIYNTNLLWC